MEMMMVKYTENNISELFLFLKKNFYHLKTYLGKYLEFYIFLTFTKILI